MSFGFLTRNCAYFGGSGPGEIDGDGTVGGPDLGALLGDWGRCMD
jgi:hypothetical protein